MSLRCRLGWHKWEQIGRRGPLNGYTPVDRCARCGCGRYLTLAGAAGAWFTIIPADQMPETVETGILPSSNARSHFPSGSEVK